MSELNYYRTRLEQEAGVYVVLRPGELMPDLLKRFKKKFMKSGLNIEIRNKTFYEKPSLRKKRKRSIAERRRKREEASKVVVYKRR